MGYIPSLRTLLILSFGIITIILSSISGILVKQRLNYQIENNVSNNLIRISEEFSSQVSKSIFDRYATLQNLSNTPDFKNGVINSKKLSEDLAKLKLVEPRFAWLGYADANGKLVASTLSILEGTNVSNRTWWKTGQSGLYMSDIYQAPTLAKYLAPDDIDKFRLVDISIPVRNVRGEVIGVLCANLSWEWLVDLENAFDYPYVKNFNVQLFVINKEYKALVSPDILMGKQLFEKTLKPMDGDSNANPSGFAHDSIDGEPYIIGYTLGNSNSLVSSTLGWTIVAARKEAEAFKPIKIANMEIAAVTIIGTILTLLFSSFIAYKLTAPLNLMIFEMQKIMNKVMDVNSEIKMHTDAVAISRGYKELHQLSKEFNTLIKAIAESEFNKKYYEAIIQKQITSQEPPSDDHHHDH